MGSLKIPYLSDQEVVDRYLAGEARGLIALRAKKSDAWVVDVLIRHGVKLRTASQAISMSVKSRAENKAMREGRIREYARGTTGRRRA
jgi:hypothetical protein